MKINGKMKTAGKFAGLALAAAMLFSATPVTAAMQASAMGNSEELNAEDGLLTSDLITDGGFEGLTVSEGKAGAWTVDTSSEAAGSRGSASVVEDAYAGESALKLTAPGNSSGYPEISQEITVLPNTTYYLSLRLKIDGTATSGSNIFYGLASRERTDEKIYGQQHRWNENAVDLDKVYKTEGEWNETNGFSYYNARVTTGNDTDVRFFLRVQKVSVIVDEISVTYEGEMLPGLGEGKNLLKNAGFEESIGANALKDWESLAMPENGAEIGIDKLDASTFMPGTQDKQIEGANALYIAAKSGVEKEDEIAIGQAVSVEANTQYSFYANFSKWDQPQYIDGEDGKIPVGLQSVTIGVYGADKETVLAQKRISGSDISICRYILKGITANSGDNTTVYPFIKISAVGFGTYGQGLYVDDCSFFKTSLDLPEGKTNLLFNGDFAQKDEGWYNVNGWCNQNDASFVTTNNAGANQWWPYSGFYQSVSLKADTLYKATAYVEGWAALPNPGNILVIKGNDADMDAVNSAARGLWDSGDVDGANAKYAELEVVAQQTFNVESDMVYRPVTLIFSVKEAGDYTFFFGFRNSAGWGDDGNLQFIGGMNIGGASVYETSMEELSPIKKDETYDDYLVNTDETNIAFADTQITVKTQMSVSEFLDAVYAAPGYTMKLVNADGQDVTSGNLESGYRVIVSKDGEEVKSYGVTVTAQGGNEKPDPDQPKKENSLVWVWVVVGIGAAALVGGAIAAVMIVRNKKNK